MQTAPLGGCLDRQGRAEHVDGDRHVVEDLSPAGVLGELRLHAAIVRRGDDLRLRHHRRLDGSIRGLQRLLSTVAAGGAVVEAAVAPVT